MKRSLAELIRQFRRITPKPSFQVNDIFRDYPVCPPLAERIAVDGMLDAAISQASTCFRIVLKVPLHAIHTD